MVKQINPIPFNPDMMTISQAKECAVICSTLFVMLNRNAEPVEIAGFVEQARSDMIMKWAGRQ